MRTSPAQAGASHRVSCVAFHVAGFTLIELILIMALLIVAVSLVTPRLESFFRGRAVDSEARQLLALTHEAQSRAVSDGVPMQLWLDEKQGAYGVEEEPSYEDKDPKAEEFTLDEGLQLKITGPQPGATSGASTPAASGPHANLPQIRFMPDGSIAETSPTAIQIIGSDGLSLSLTQSRDRSQYEIEK